MPTSSTLFTVPMLNQTSTMFNTMSRRSGVKWGWIRGFGRRPRCVRGEP
ncbi:MAG TPA: hypothetical protein VFP34_01570 [Microlunatus sp.]|nr:hypothetical protein [Microlunatus sp.]